MFPNKYLTSQPITTKLHNHFTSLNLQLPCNIHCSIIQNKVNTIFQIYSQIAIRLIIIRTAKSANNYLEKTID